ncbi:CCA tRNA nucleotidyltransferase [Aestuariimicrobium kwangyangense]|uniref:CCA tRNA nucleotidyltransferase n=1 Tax=Aestuariimicrobium kwangyangense TaxID=396389 RepID=UPI0003B51D0C|nr:CCA tRNA nucleotidyltransferase [Aestuariimicrobium kwangyangense]
MSLAPAQQAAIDDLISSTPVIRRLGDLFAAAGHELYLVGGSVRDVLLGHLVNDLDFTTSARPGQTEKLLKQVADHVWDVGREFGTITARVSDPAAPATADPADQPHEAEAGADRHWLIEVTTFRADAYRSDSRKPEVNFGDSIDDDLVRRDFTVNAMAIEVSDDHPTFVDPHGGLADLAARRLMTPFAPERSFSDDPLRMMRAARFASQLDFQPAGPVIAAMTSMADRIEIISAERVRDELSRLLLTAQPARGLDLLCTTGIADHVLPELPALRLEVDEHHRHKDVYQHSLIVLQQAIELEQARGHRPDLVNRLAALLHDVGKPSTRRFEDDGRVSFHHHDVVGAKLVRKRLKALRFSSEEVKAVSKLVELHLRFHGYSDGLTGENAGWTDSAVRRYVRDAGDQLEHLHILTRADCTTRNQRKATRLRRAYDDLEARIDDLFAREELNAMRPDLDGTQIMALLDLAPGPQVGRAYQHLLDLRIENGPLGEERATEELRRWWEQQES